MGMTILNGHGLLRPMVSAIRAITVILAALPVLCGQAAAQGAVRSVHGDWQIRCDTPPGAQGEQCALMQSVQSEERPNIGLTIIILRPAGTGIHLMRVLAPPGVLLPQALGLKIDDVNVGRAGYVRCLPNGCVAEVTMSEDLIQKLRNGHTATFIVFLTPEEGIGFPVSLKGFGEGFDQLP
jgi:invasion protein IalB